MKLLNLFKKKKEIKYMSVKINKPNNDIVTINNRQYILDKTEKINVQPYSGDITIYGWTLEYSYKFLDKKYYTSYNNKVYSTRESAVNAMIQIRKSSYGRNYDDWRISALYKMDEVEYRDFLIKQIFKSDEEKEMYEQPSKYWKVIEDHEFKYNSYNNVKLKKGTIFQFTPYKQNSNMGKVLILSTPTIQNGYYIYSDLLNKIISMNLVKEVDIKEESWIHPHLPKELKIKYNL